MARIITFFEFCTQQLKLNLDVGQGVIVKVAFDGVAPKDLETEEERTLAEEIFAGVEAFPDKCRRLVALELGRGSGKTTIVAAWMVYCVLITDLTAVGPGDMPVAAIVAPDKPTAKISVRMCREMIRANAYLERLLTQDQVNGNNPFIELRRPDGRLVQIAAFAATRGGYSVRGRTIISFVLDEAQFFAGDDIAYAVNDRHIYGALIPRLLVKHGKGFFISTPWPVETMMAELMQELGKPQTCLAARASTLQMRGSNQDIADMISAEVDRDPENAEREFFCRVVIGGGDSWFDAAAIEASLSDAQKLPPNPNWPTSVGVDFAFKRDSSSIVVVQYNGERYVTAYYEEIKPKPGQPLKPSEICARFASIANEYGARGVIADGHYEESIREHLRAANLNLYLAPAGATGKEETYKRAKAVLHEGQCVLPRNKRFVNQLKMVRGIPTQGGGISIRSPRKKGLGHGDLVSAWVLGVNDLAYARLPAAARPARGTPEAELLGRIRAAKEEADIEAKHLAKMEREAAVFAERAARLERRDRIRQYRA